ncbi:prepilin-type N-terminal cleavage/methylation domain-containing protein [Poriferisphaera sp. WC338]|uniref:prepilin-type N-terminal cleavage/methylation domain-containing protein n=1 Tax=Poriferisphaera sp. WC338 TaxID=3425129 RepID=UPI003D81A540
MTELTKQHKSSMRRGFSLIEILVVIGIIGILMAILIPGLSKAKESAQESQTRSIMAGLNGIVADFEVKTHKPVWHMSDLFRNWSASKNKNVDNTSHNPSQTAVIRTSDQPESEALESTATEYNYTYEKTAATNANLYGERFVSAAYQLPGLRNALASLGGSVITDLDDDGFLEIRDPWGNNIAYGFQTRHGNASEDQFLPAHGRPFFASPGLDGLWGSTAPNATDNEKKAAEDNIYSFNVDKTNH